jgi:beta-lactamase regulating signal transducer with metallopeptidase domain
VFVANAMLGNAAVTLVLAAIAWAISRVSRSPPVRHAAWVIVLLQLFAPPLIRIPFVVLPASLDAGGLFPFTGDVSASASTEPGVSPEASTDARISSSQWLLLAWGGGATVWFVWQGRRIASFRGRVQRAEPASPELRAAADQLAAALGIPVPPQVKLVTGIGSPMLWGWGRSAVVLFPRDLLPRLSAEGRDALLAHELAHFLRRDHWIRYLEFFATGLYWWHPAVWLARHEIEAAEEECCDAWVVGGLVSSPRKYAEALLATVDFEAELRRPCLPPGACAAKRGARLLHRRLVGILHAAAPGRPPGGITVRLLVLAILITRPALRASSPDPVDAPTSHSANRAPLPHRNVKKLQDVRHSSEPRSWATAESTSLTVLARDKELLLRRADGSTSVLGPGRPIAVSFAPRGRRIATAGPGTLVRTWDEVGILMAEAKVSNAARSVAYTPDGSRLLVLDSAGGITVLDQESLVTVANWSVGSAANSIFCSTDNRTVAVSSGSWLGESGAVECWSIDEKRKLASYPFSVPVGASRLSPDGKMLVAGGWNGSIIWLSLPSGEPVAERRLSKELVAGAAFCPDAGTLPLDPPPEPVPVTTLGPFERQGQP